MNHLIDLVDLIPLSKVRFLEVMGKRDDKAEKLYHLLHQAKVQSEEQAIQLLMPDDQYGKVNFWKIKKKLKDRLINTFLASQPNDLTEVQRAYFECYKAHAIVNILIGRGKRNVAIHLAEYALKNALKYELTDLSLSLSRRLVRHYAIVSVNKQKRKKYESIIRENLSLLGDEIRAELIYCDFASLAQSKRGYTKQNIEQANEYKNELNAMITKHQSYWLMMLASNVSVFYHQITNNQQGIIESCEKALLYFSALPYMPPYSARFAFLFKMIPAYLKLGEMEQSEKYVQECLELAPSGSHNENVATEYWAILKLHQEEYTAAFAITQEMIAKKSSNIEAFRIYNAYAAFMLDQDIKLGKLLNELPRFSNDKRGMNINILVLQVLFYLRKGQRGHIIDRMAALERYSYRYLKKDETFRSNCFIHMLLSLEKGNFTAIGVKRSASKYLARLKEMPISKSGQDIDVEIIPYERLWVRVLKMLG